MVLYTTDLLCVKSYNQNLPFSTLFLKLLINYSNYRFYLRGGGALYLENGCLGVVVEFVFLLAVSVHEKCIECQPDLPLQLTQLQSVPRHCLGPLVPFKHEQLTYTHTHS